MYQCMHAAAGLVWFGFWGTIEVPMSSAGRNFRGRGTCTLAAFPKFLSTGFPSFPKRIALFIGPPPCRECIRPRILVCLTRSTSIGRLIVCIYLSFARLLHTKANCIRGSAFTCFSPGTPTGYGDSNTVHQIASKCLDQTVCTFLFVIQRWSLNLSGPIQMSKIP